MMIILFVTFFFLPRTNSLLQSHFWLLRRHSLITYILINFPNMFYIFYVSILDFDDCYCDFLQLIPQSVSNVFLNMYSFCYEAVITVNFIILQLVQIASIQYASFGAKL